MNPVINRATQTNNTRSVRIAVMCAASPISPRKASFSTPRHLRLPDTRLWNWPSGSLVAYAARSLVVDLSPSCRWSQLWPGGFDLRTSIALRSAIACWLRPRSSLRRRLRCCRARRSLARASLRLRARAQLSIGQCRQTITDRSGVLSCPKPPLRKTGWHGQRISVCRISDFGRRSSLWGRLEFHAKFTQLKRSYV